MATRIALQEIPVLPPETEEQTFVVVAEEAIPDFCNEILPFSGRAHAKYISSDESKENITPAEFDGLKKYNYGKSDVGKAADLMESNNPGDRDDVALITPQKDTDCSDWRIGESNTPVDFSNVTVDAFGISSESFANCVGKSPRSLHKHRRRSTIGVRGSPEMNFLIRQIALQRSKKTSPEPLSNPFISPRNSILKEKMLSFRNAFQAVEESEGKLPFPGFCEEEEETQCDTLGSKAYGNTCETAEPPVKRKRVCDPLLPEIEGVPVKPHAPLTPTQPQRTAQETKQVPVLEKISESDGSSVSRFFPAVSNLVNMQNEEIQPTPSSTRGQKRKVMFADHLSSLESEETLCHNPAVTSDSHTSSSPVLRPVLKKTSRKEFSRSRDEIGVQRVCFSAPEPSENESNTLFKKTVNDSMKKKKRVTFGKKLSPEVFDKTLPANTPLRKGSTPCRQQVSDTATPTAQEAIHQSPGQPLSQPDFDCQDDEDTFKPSSLNFDTDSPSQESTKSSPETFIASEPDTVPTNSRVTRSSNNSKQACISEDPLTSENSQTADDDKVPVSATAKPSSKRGRKLVSIKRVEVKVPKVKGKKGRGRPKKSVQKSMYGKREMASKKPLLSPIPELPERYPTPASTRMSPGGVVKKGLKKSIVKRKVIRRDNRNIEKKNVHSEAVDLCSDPMILKFEDVTEDSGCPGKECLEVKYPESLRDSQGHTEPADVVAQVGTLSTKAECPFSAEKEMKQNEECLSEPDESLPEDKRTTETVSALKPQKSKRRSSTRRRVSQATTEFQHAANTETPLDLSETLNAEHTLETITEDPKPETDLLAEHRTHSFELPVITDIASGKKGRRSSRNYSMSAMFCPSTEPNTYTQDPCIVLPQPDENSTTFTSEPCLSIDEILQSAGTEKKVRRSMRLRRDSGASGLFWVQEKTSSEGTSRRKSLSSAVQPLGNSNLNLESITCSPNKEQLSIQQVPSAAKKTRRRTLCTSTQEKMASLGDTKRRRSNVSHKDSYVLSAEPQTCHSNIMLDT